MGSDSVDTDRDLRLEVLLVKIVCNAGTAGVDQANERVGSFGLRVAGRSWADLPLRPGNLVRRLDVNHGPRSTKLVGEVQDGKSKTRWRL